jgi:hypothetical protein
VARRKYGRSDALSAAGQQERPRDPSGDESLQQPLEPRGEYGKTPPEPASGPAQPVSNLGEQLHAIRQQQQSDQLDHYIGQMFPGATPGERQWLRANVHHLSNHHPTVIHHAAGIALQRGVPRESPEFLHFIGQLLDQHHAAMQAQPAPPPAAPMPPPMPPPVATHIEAESHDSEPEVEPMPSHSVSAPVSRASEAYSADYEPTDGSRITLSKAEREHAEAAGVSVEEYGRQKLRMMKMKKAKLIRDE